MKLTKRMLRKIIRENVDDLGVDQSVNIPTKYVHGRSESPKKDMQQGFGWVSKSARRGRLDPSTFSVEDDTMHIFDFDDTLGEGFGPTLVAAAVVWNGQLRPVTNLIKVLIGMDIQALGPAEAEQMEGFQDALQANSMTIIRNRWFQADGAEGLNGAEVATLDTAGFADFRANFSKIESDQKLPVPMDVGGENIPRGPRRPEHQIDLVVGGKGFTTMDGVSKNIKRMKGKPDGSVLIAYDFSPSLTLGKDIERYPATNQVALDAQNEDEPIGVITARKGTTAFDSFSGNRPVAMNSADMQKFMMDGGLDWTAGQKGGGLKFVHGAADYSNDGGKQKAALAKGEWLKQPQKNLRFYDDDKRNAVAMSALCDDEQITKKKDGGTINIYSQPHGGFKKTIGKPIFSCMIGENRVHLTESQFRKLIRKLLVK